MRHHGYCLFFCHDSSAKSLSEKIVKKDFDHQIKLGHTSVRARDLKNKATAFSLPCFALCFAQNKVTTKEFCFDRARATATEKNDRKMATAKEMQKKSVPLPRIVQILYRNPNIGQKSKYWPQIYFFDMKNLKFG